MSETGSISEKPLTHSLMEKGKELYEVQRRQEVADAVRNWLKRKCLDYRRSRTLNLPMSKIAETILKALDEDKSIFFGLTENPEIPLLTAQKFKVEGTVGQYRDVKTVIALQAHADLTAADLEKPENEALFDKTLVALYRLHSQHFSDLERLHAFHKEIRLKDDSAFSAFPEIFQSKNKDSSQGPFDYQNTSS